MSVNLKLVVKESSPIETALHLTNLNAEFPNGVVGLDRIYGMALVMADYQHDGFPIGPFAEMSLEHFCDMLMTAQFVDQNLIPLDYTKSIAIHNERLKKHFYVIPQSRRLHTTDKGRIVFYNHGDRDGPATDFKLQVLYEGIATLEGKTYGKPYTMDADNEEDVGNVIDFLGLTEHEFTDYVITVPSVI